MNQLHSIIDESIYFDNRLIQLSKNEELEKILEPIKDENGPKTSIGD